MLFNSLIFITVFIIVILFYYNIKSWKIRKFLLLGSSYFLYALSNPIFVLFLFFSTVLDWFLATWISKTDSLRKKRLYVFCSVVVNIGLLLYFKAGLILVNLLNSYFADFNLIIPYQPSNYLIPIGISFYTFQTISFTVDVFRDEIKRPKSFFDYALYVSFFPQLVAGPIVRAGDFFPQCHKKKSFNTQTFSWGLFLFITGLFQKVVISDTILSPTVGLVFTNTTPGIHWVDAWIGSTAFAAQLFLDFSGYSTCAIGVALMLGFSIKDNFRSPLAAIGFNDFWKRWHISLYNWFKDYVFIPLGGSRVSIPRVYLNILILTVLSGLWHRFSLTFLVWGLIHGVLIILESTLVRLFRKNKFLSSSALKIPYRILTSLILILTIVLFRVVDLNQAFLLFKAMLGFTSNTYSVIPSFYLLSFFAVVPIVIASHWYFYNRDFAKEITKLPKSFLVSMITFMLCSLILAQGKGNDFIYFQF
jgi:alginate O-acetyltransferase complex protein AlgI